MFVDPIALAVITSAITAVARDAAQAAAGPIAQLWKRVVGILGVDASAKDGELAEQVASVLINKPDMAKQLLELLKQERSETGTSTLVGSITAEKVVLAYNMHVGTMII